MVYYGAPTLTAFVKMKCRWYFLVLAHAFPASRMHVKLPNR